MMKISSNMNIYSRTDAQFGHLHSSKGKSSYRSEKEALSNCIMISSSKDLKISSKKKRFLFILFLFISLSLSAQTPIASYPFSGNANDESSNGYNGILKFDASLTKDRFGNDNSAVYLDGTADYVELPVIFIGDRDPFSISTWVKLDAGFNNGTLFGEFVNTQDDTRNGVFLHTDRSSYDQFGPTLGTADVSFDFLSNTQKWLHVVHIKNADQVSLYVNGSFIGSAAHSETYSGATSDICALGRRLYLDQSDETYLALEACIDDVKLYDEALTPAQIKQLYANYHPPANFKILSTVDELTLSWDSTRISQIDKYLIYRDHELYDSVMANSNADTTFTDSIVFSGTEYTYYVTSVDDLGFESIHSDTLTETALHDGPLFTEMTSINLTGVSNGSVAWGDYDNDDDLDILLTGNGSTKLYINKGANVFEEQISNSLLGASYSSANWIDYNNDGNLDIFITGEVYSKPADPYSKLYKNSEINTFSDQTSFVLPYVSSGSVDWGDFNNDGKNDIILTGSGVSKIYKNTENSSFIEQTDFSLTGVSGSSVAWGDYDNDNDLDILLTGDKGAWPYSTIFKNINDKLFTEQMEISLTGVMSSSVAWGDYDNDEDLDLFLSGDNLNMRHSKIYRNEGNNLFTDIRSSLTRIQNGSGEWGDYDNDGDLDLYLSGNDSVSRVSEIYIQDNGVFILQPIDLVGVEFSSVKWGDYDNDGDLDILLTGQSDEGYISKIYRNNSQTKNTLPQAPTALTSTPNADSVLFSWTAATDNETPSPGLSYNVFVRSSTDTIVMPHSNPITGYVKIPEMGNAQLGSEFLLKELGAGTYYWKVQAVDNCFAGGAWSTESTFTIASVPEIIAAQNSLDFGQCTPNGNYNLTLKVVSAGNDSLTVNSISNLSEPYATNFSSTVKIGKQDSLDINITFNPTATGYFYDTLIVNSDAVNQPALKIPVKGFVATNACADGVVIEADATWTKANSPYLVSCNMVVMSAATLTIEPGVTVVMDTAKKITIDGTLVANGLEGDSIVFTNNGDTNVMARFDQIYLRNGSSSLSYFKFENSINGLYTENTTNTIKHGFFQYNTTALNCRTDSTYIDSCTFIDNIEGVYFKALGEPVGAGFAETTLSTINACSFSKNKQGVNLNSGYYKIAESKFTSNTEYGIHTENNYELDEKSVIQNCEFTNNAIGAKIYRVLFQNNTINLSTNYGLYADDCTVSLCDVSDNTGNGIEVVNATITDCKVYNNGAHGIVSPSGWPVTISKNAVFNNTEAGIHTGGLPVITYNNIYANGSYNVHATQQGADTINAENNYWGTAVADEIKASIYDIYYDGVTIRVDFEPFATDTIYILSAPSNLQAVAQGMTQINLSWTDNSDDETGFVLERSTTAESGFAEIETTLANVTSYVDTGLNSSTTYYYRIKAINAKGASEYTAVSSVATESLFTEMTSINLTGVSNGSVAWGDYDNDNDLDILVTGNKMSNMEMLGETAIYKNMGNDVFEEQQILFDTKNSTAQWTDFDNDNYLDAVIIGDTSRAYMNNAGNGFTKIGKLSFDSFTYSSIDCGDYNNDGRFEFALSGEKDGNPKTELFKNIGDFDFALEESHDLVNMSHGFIQWSDVDNDGDIDLLESGYTQLISWPGINFYSNNYPENSFTNIDEISMPKYTFSSLCYGDYDNDSDLDLIYLGTPDGGAGAFTKIFKNNGEGTFSELTNLNLNGSYQGSVVWGDINNNGKLDFLLSGRGGGDPNITQIYLNEGSDNFNILEGTSFKVVYESSVIVGDYDNDNDLDILISGNSDSGPITKIYRNNTTEKNTPPNAPTNLSATLNEEGLQLNWAAATDNETPSPGLNYNIFMRGPDGSMVTAPMADTVTGYRRIVERGHIQTTFWKMDTTGMAHGQYYWKVQAIDAAFAGGAWSQMGSFTLSNDASPVVTLVAPAANSMDVDTTGVSLTWTGVDPEGTALTYDVYFGTEANPPLVSENQSATTYTLPQLNAATIYYWKIEAEDEFGNVTASPIQKFTTWKNDAPLLTLIAPANGKDGGPLYVDLIWSATDDENDELSFDVYFESEGYGNTTEANYTDTILRIDTLSYGQTYYWQVTAKDSYGNTTISDKWSFSIDENDPPLINLLSPANDSTNTPIVLNLQWQATDDENDELSFTINYAENDDSNPISIGNYKANSMEVSGLKRNTTYKWKVTANDSYGNTTPSEERQFTTTALESGWLQLAVTNNTAQALADATYNFALAGNSMYSGVTDQNGKSDILYFEKDVYHLKLNSEGYFHISEPTIEPVTDDTTELAIQMNLLGDYNNDGAMTQDDLDYLVGDWHAENPRLEMGPVNGTAPNFNVEPDGIIDFEDLMVFGQMWRYNNSRKSASIYSATKSTRSVVNTIKVEGSTTLESNILSIHLNLKGNEALISGKLHIKYNTTNLEYLEANDKLSHDVSSVSYIDNHAEEGLLEIHSGVFTKAALDNNQAYFTLQFKANSKNALPEISYEMHQPDNTASIGKVLLSNMANALRIYPNPANEQVFIYAPKTPESVVVSDITGKQLHKLIPESKHIKIDVSSFEKGLIIIQVAMENETLIQKVVKQ